MPAVLSHPGASKSVCNILSDKPVADTDQLAPQFTHRHTSYLSSLSAFALNLPYLSILFEAPPPISPYSLCRVWQHATPFRQPESVQRPLGPGAIHVEHSSQARFLSERSNKGLFPSVAISRSLTLGTLILQVPSYFVEVRPCPPLASSDGERNLCPIFCHRAFSPSMASRTPSIGGKYSPNARSNFYAFLVASAL